MYGSPPGQMERVRLWLILGRVSNLPTVWTNCLAGWLLSGGGPLGRFLVLAVGTSCLYIGGMFLNDACDTDFDSVHRRERPIPAGLIDRHTVWQLSLLWLGAGAGLLFTLGTGPGMLGLWLVATIVLYDLVHKWITFAPVLMAACRFLLYLVAGAAAAKGLSGNAVWAGLALAFYIVGLSYVARGESTHSPVSYWPCILLVAPVFLASLVNGPGYRASALWLSLIYVVWCVRCLHPLFRSVHGNVGRVVSGLLAGITLVDLLAVANQPPMIGGVFLLLFGVALWLQRTVPAT